MVDAVLFAWGHTLAIWAPDDEPRDTVRRLESTTHALLEALRKRGLKLGVVSNASDPPAVLRGELAESVIEDSPAPTPAKPFCQVLRSPSFVPTIEAWRTSSSPPPPSP